MGERAFPGITFTSIENRRRVNLKPDVARVISSSNQQMHDLHLLLYSDGALGDPDFTVQEPLRIEPSYNWEFDALKADFQRVIRVMESSLGTDFGFGSREIDLVVPHELIPQDLTRRDALVVRYGAYILDGIAGGCQQLDGGKFRLRIGAKDQRQMTHIDVLEVMAHEFGHTLGEILDDPIDEELKAYAFESIFMRFFYEVDIFEDDFEGLSPERIHDLALDRLAQLTTKGISVEEILAHLTGMDLGKTTPLDYLNHV